MDLKGYLDNISKKLNDQLNLSIIWLSKHGLWTCPFEHDPSLFNPISRNGVWRTSPEIQSQHQRNWLMVEEGILKTNLHSPHFFFDCSILNRKCIEVPQVLVHICGSSACLRGCTHLLSTPRIQCLSAPVAPSLPCFYPTIPWLVPHSPCNPHEASATYMWDDIPHYSNPHSFLPRHFPCSFCIPQLFKNLLRVFESLCDHLASIVRCPCCNCYLEHC